MSLASKLLELLSDFRRDVGQQVNSGQLVTIDDHIDRVAAVIDSDVNEADARAKRVLGELYGALHGATAPDEPGLDAVVEDPAPAAPVDPAPVTDVPPPAPSVPVATVPTPEPEPSPEPVPAPDQAEPTA